MPLLSIIIPTRNRPDYAVNTIGVVLAHCHDVEVVVSDNSDDDRLRHRLRADIDGGTVRYSHTAETLDIVANFERALAMATGRYVMIIGDDDGIGPGISEVARWAEANAVDAVVSYADTFVVSYFWPGVRSKYFGDAVSAKLFVYPLTGTAAPIDGRASIGRVAADPGGNLKDLPRVYHGLVARQLLETIRIRFGSVFGGLSPDVFAGVLIAVAARRIVRVDYPFVIPGLSPSSAAGQGSARADRGDLRSFEHIARYGDRLVWDARIPEFYAPIIVWSFTLQKALDCIPESGITANYPRLFACCLIYHWRYRRQTLAAVAAWRGRRSWPAASVAIAISAVDEMARQVKRVVFRLRHPRAGGNAHGIGDLATIADAYRALDEHLARVGPPLRLPAAPGAAVGIGALTGQSPTGTPPG